MDVLRKYLVSMFPPLSVQFSDKLGQARPDWAGENKAFTEIREREIWDPGLWGFKFGHIKNILYRIPWKNAQRF